MSALEITPGQQGDIINAMATEAVLQFNRQAGLLAQAGIPVPLAIELVGVAMITAILGHFRSAVFNGVFDQKKADQFVRDQIDRIMKLEMRVMERQPDGTFGDPQPIN